MHALVVHAHPEPRSFCAALRDTAVDELTHAGVTVEVSDLYEDGFVPVLSWQDFLAPAEPAFLRPMEEQAAAVTGGTLAPDVQEQVDRLVRADLVVVTAPLWWYSVPAIMKGWFDRVLVNGVAYGVGDVKPYQGPLTGKRALLTLTAANDESDFTAERAGTLETVLRPIVHGTFRYVGMEALQPFVAYGADSVDEDARRRYLASYRTRLQAAVAR
jgi:NAD(P)H dehydrogenase (quinone)